MTRRLKLEINQVLISNKENTESFLLFSQLHRHTPKRKEIRGKTC